METQLKQRLTGAVILVALAVLLVPEILSGPAGRRSGAKPVAEQTTPASPGSGAPIAATEVGNIRSYTIDLSNDAQVVAGAAPVSANNSSAATEEGTVESAPGGDAARTSAPTAAQATTPVADENATSVMPPSAGAFAVQVGSFGNPANAERLTRELKSKGFPAYVEDPDGAGPALARVRVGPVANRDAASGLLEQLRAAGQSGAVVPIS